MSINRLGKAAFSAVIALAEDGELSYNVIHFVLLQRIYIAACPSVKC